MGDLLQLIVEQGATAPVLLLATARLAALPLRRNGCGGRLPHPIDHDNDFPSTGYPAGLPDNRFATRIQYGIQLTRSAWHGRPSG